VSRRRPDGRWPKHAERYSATVADRDQDLITAMQAHRAGHLHDAYSAYIRALSKRPDNETARYHLGILEMQRGRTDDALRHLKTAAQLAPGNAAIQFDLGRALLQTGQLDPAAGIFEALSQRAGEHPEINYHLALVREKQGRLEEAERELQRALALQPDHLGALLHSGHLSLRRNDKTTAAARFESALEQSPANGDALVALAGLREEAGALDAAEDLLRRAIDVAAPDVPDAHVRLSRLLESKDQPEKALRVAQLATQHCPGHDIAWRQLGQLLKRQGHLEEAVAAFGRGHALLRDPDSGYGLNRPEIRRTNKAKLRHDIDQLRYIRSLEPDRDDLDRVILEHEALQGALPHDLGEGDVVGLNPATIVKLGGHYNRCIQRIDAPALPDGALNPALDPGAITEDYLRRGPGITWIDGFLRPEALASLRSFLLESTIWYDADHPNGYVGAYLHDGFDCPLILQIAEELPALLPQIFGQRPLLQLWAYHYDSRLSGIDMHADFAAVNVNFWLTPDDAMLDPGSGGMRIWDKQAPARWGPSDFNTADPETKTRIDEYLAAEGARELVVPHRQNRVVIFNSDLFHRTDDIRFRDGFDNRRINVTMLYGTREQG